MLKKYIHREKSATVFDVKVYPNYELPTVGGTAYPHAWFEIGPQEFQSIFKGPRKHRDPKANLRVDSPEMYVNTTARVIDDCDDSTEVPALSTLMTTST